MAPAEEQVDLAGVDLRHHRLGVHQLHLVRIVIISTMTSLY